MAAPHSVDDILAQQAAPEASTVPEVAADTQEAPKEVEKQAPKENTVDSTVKSDDKSTETDNKAEITDEYGQTESTPEAGEVDDYGNGVPKARMYSEEEVQRMIRDRLSRGNHQPQQATPQQVQQAAQDFVADPNSQQTWEQQLDAYIDRRLEHRQTKAQQDQWEQQERHKQADYEAKFNTGMNKYRDFRDVVTGKPITDSMMMATRSMNDPAAFIYAASKNFPKELERIAQIPDAYQQAAEIGKLDERMKRKPTISNTPKPSTNVKGDMVDNSRSRGNLDDLIARDARRKQRR